jgi:hypothetical protein
MAKSGSVAQVFNAHIDLLIIVKNYNRLKEVTQVFKHYPISLLVQLAHV